MMITDMTDITTTADLNDRNDGNAVADTAATPSAWPYSACSGILDRKLAANIRAWALTNKSGPHMTEAELHSYSQGRLLGMYLEEHIRPTLERLAPWMRMAVRALRGAIRFEPIGAVVLAYAQTGGAPE
jgi:hypothetical protein